MTDHGVRGRLHPLTRLSWMQRHYPWSVLWILFMVAVALIVARLLVETVVVVGLIVIVAFHSVHLDREAKRKGKSDVVQRGTARDRGRAS